MVMQSSVDERVERGLRRSAEALRRGDAAAAFKALADCTEDSALLQGLTYTPGIAQQLAELGALSDEQGPRSENVRLVFIDAVARCTERLPAGHWLCLHVARDPAVARCAGRWRGAATASCRRLGPAPAPPSSAGWLVGA